VGRGRKEPLSIDAVLLLLKDPSRCNLPLVARQPEGHALSNAAAAAGGAKESGSQNRIAGKKRKSYLL